MTRPDRAYYEEQERKTLFALTNPSLRPNERRYLKSRLSAIKGALERIAMEKLDELVTKLVFPQ